MDFLSPNRRKQIRGNWLLVHVTWLFSGCVSLEAMPGASHGSPATGSRSGTYKAPLILETALLLETDH